MRPAHLENLSRDELVAELKAGGRLVFYEFCISVIFATLRCPTRIRLLRAGQYGWLRGLPFTLLSFLLGWWGLPWGPIFTVLVIFNNIRGGQDVTGQVMDLLDRGYDEKSPAFGKSWASATETPVAEGGQACGGWGP
jgi:hypothetical protein